VCGRGGGLYWAHVGGGKSEPPFSEVAILRDIRRSGVETGTSGGLSPFA